MKRHYGIVRQKTTASMDRSARVSLCRTSRAVTVANFRADMPGASVIRVVYTSNNLLLTPATRGIVNIIDVSRGRLRMPRNCASVKRRAAALCASTSILIIYFSIDYIHFKLDN